MSHPREELSPEGDDGEEPVVIDEGDAAPASDDGLDPKRAYEILEIRTPLEEFETYGRARIETLAKLGEAGRAEITAAALELGRRAIARVTGVPLGERRPS
jgi:hypothetical protein